VAQKRPTSNLDLAQGVVPDDPYKRNDIAKTPGHLGFSASCR
jgi:hypothetical protein